MKTLNTEKFVVTVNTFEDFTDMAEVVDIYGQGCNYPAAKGMQGWMAMSNVTVKNIESGEEKKFDLQFDQDARTCNIKAYNGLDVCFDGVNESDNEAMQEFTDRDKEVDKVILDFAEAEAKKYFEVISA